MSAPAVPPRHGRTTPAAAPAVPARGAASPQQQQQLSQSGALGQSGSLGVSGGLGQSTGLFGQSGGVTSPQNQPRQQQQQQQPFAFSSGFGQSGGLAQSGGLGQSGGLPRSAGLGQSGGLGHSGGLGRSAGLGSGAAAASGPLANNRGGTRSPSTMPLQTGGSLDSNVMDLSSTTSLGRSAAAITIARLQEQKAAERRAAAKAALELQKPPTPEYRTVKIFQLNKWTRRFSIVIFVACVLCAFVPQFIFYVQSSHTFGLFQECIGMACLPANLTILQRHPSCKADCNSDANFRGRFAASAGMIWISVVASALLGTVQYLHYARQFIIPLNGILFPTLIFMILGVGVYVAGLAIVGSSLDIGYESTPCAQREGCLVYGASSYVSVFGVILLFVSGLSGLVACMFHRHRLGLKSAFFEKLIGSSVANDEPEKEATRAAQYEAKGEKAEEGKDGGEDEDDEDESTAPNSLDETGKSFPILADTEEKDGAAAAAAGNSNKKKKKQKKKLEEDKEEVDEAATLMMAESGIFQQTKSGDFNTSSDDDDDDDDDDEEEEANKKKEAEAKNAPLANIGDATANNKKSSSSSSGSKKKQKANPALKEVKTSVRSSRGWQRIFNQVSIFCAGMAAIFAIGSVMGPRWVFLTPANTSSLGSYSIGLIAECTDLTCTRLDSAAYSRLLVNSTACGNTAVELESRLGFCALFFLLTAVFSVPQFFTASKLVECLRGPIKRKVFTVLTWLMALIAVALMMETFDSWVNCDVPWCEAYLAANPDGSCEYGFMFGMALVAICSATLLLTMNAIQSCCRPCGYEIGKECASEEATRSLVFAGAASSDAEMQGGLPPMPAMTLDSGAMNGQQQPQQQYVDDDDEHHAPPPSSATGATPKSAAHLDPSPPSAVPARAVPTFVVG